MTTTVLRISTAAIASLALFAAPIASPESAHAAASDWWLKGASVIPSGTEEFSSDRFKQAVRDFQAAGGTYINFIVPYYQSNLYSTDIQRGYNTPSDAALTSGIDYVRSLGMHAQLSVYLESWTGEWRAELNPGDRDTWYRNYESVLMHYGSLGQAHGVELYQLGAELIKMASGSVNGDNTWRWQNMISNVRGVYSGKLTYSANRGGQDWASELPNIGFWDRLDYIGVSAYYELPGDGSAGSMEGHWQSIENWDIKPVHDRWGKPVIFTEVGYRSVSGAHNEPWNSWMGGGYDPQIQVNAYSALFNFWGARSYMQGATLWWWSPDPNYGGEGNTDYTPNNKPAENTLRDYWSGGGTPPPPPPPTGTPAFSSTGSVTPSSPAAGEAVTLSANVTNTGDAITGAIVDFEVYNGSTRVFQNYFENQSFSNGETKPFGASWTPTANGTYTFKIGVFANGWSHTYAWNDGAAKITVGGGTENAVTNVWWPTDGAHVSGVQPFKAMLEGMDISQYRMYWQVDGGGLVEMGDSMEGWPHKESLVDLSGWSWKSGNPYTITFVSKNAGGATISTKSVEIFIP